MLQVLEQPVLLPLHRKLIFSIQMCPDHDDHYSIPSSEQLPMPLLKNESLLYIVSLLDTMFFQLGLKLTDPQTVLNCPSFEVSMCSVYMVFNITILNLHRMIME